MSDAPCCATDAAALKCALHFSSHFGAVSAALCRSLPALPTTSPSGHALLDFAPLRCALRMAKPCWPSPPELDIGDDAAARFVSLEDFAFGAAVGYSDPLPTVAGTELMDGALSAQSTSLPVAAGATISVISCSTSPFAAEAAPLVPITGGGGGCRRFASVKPSIAAVPTALPNRPPILPPSAAAELRFRFSDASAPALRTRVSRDRAPFASAPALRTRVSRDRAPFASAPPSLQPL